MILDVELPPKSPVSSVPTFRQISGPSVGRPASYATFSDVRHGAQYDNGGRSETRPLLYQPSAESMYDDTEPPSYDEVNPLPKTSAARSRFWIRCVAAFLVVFVLLSAFYTYNFSGIRRPVPTPPDLPGGPSPPATTGGPAIPSPFPSPNHPSPPPLPPTLPAPLPPLPPTSDIPNPHTAPFVLPIKGRTDLCRPWAYSSEPGVSPSISDNRPMDKLVYTIPTHGPIHMETSAVCLTPNGTSEFCDQYDDSYDSIAGKLQVVGADIELPRIEITIQHGSETGLDSTSVCLFKRLDENGKDRWVIGIYTWKDPTTTDRDVLLISMSIVVTLPRTQIHDFSTRLNYFTQVIGPEIKTDSNALVFDTLQTHLAVRGSLVVRNITAAVIDTQSLEDTQFLSDTRVTKSIQMQSDSGVIACFVTLVQTEDSPEVHMNLQSIVGAVSSNATLEYSYRLSSPPQYVIEIYSKVGPAMIFINDPQGTNLLRQYPGVIPSMFPIIRANATSYVSIAQVIVPATFYGALNLVSKHAAIVTVDHAKEIPGRTVSYQPTNTGYQATVQWAGRTKKPEEAGFVSAATEYASARLLFLGLDDDNISSWPEEVDAITSLQ
ncbi:unnamed protein product [Rhizoctonia solani]|uniref:Transmembrane protein n=1 Tax=Rhizoctonia solani TaxID=456999 RepID=A0A8H3CQF3_9AGAM|nr:unnamed protein product [Rhizoctonia solani]